MANFRQKLFATAAAAMLSISPIAASSAYSQDQQVALNSTTEAIVKECDKATGAEGDLECLAKAEEKSAIEVDNAQKELDCALKVKGAYKLGKVTRDQVIANKSRICILADSLSL